MRAPQAAALVVLILVVVIGSFVLGNQLRNSGGGGSSPSASADIPADLAAAEAQPHLVFQNVVRDAGYAKLAIVPLSQPSAARYVTGLTCERAYFAGGHGLCLTSEHGADTVYVGTTFGPDFQPGTRITLAGLPTRARVSPDGRYGAASVQLFGRPGVTDFLADTNLIDMASGSVVADLTEFAVTRDGAAFEAPDANFYAVTFGSDGNRFYATLRAAADTYLVEGDIAARTLKVLRQNVDSPSLSPDNTRLAFRRQVSSAGPTWQFFVLDLASMTESPLAETHSIDDQIEWLDTSTLLYGRLGSIWTVPSDGTGTPSVYVQDGLSPAVVR
jgi:hypothetical protein